MDRSGLVQAASLDRPHLQLVFHLRLCSLRLQRSPDWGSLTSRSAGIDSNVAIAHCQALGRVVTAPAPTGKIHFCPSMEVVIVSIGLAFLVAADKSSCQPDRPTGFHKQHGEIATGAVLLLPSQTWRKRFTRFAQGVATGGIDALIEFAQPGNRVISGLQDLLRESDRLRIECTEVAGKVGLKLTQQRSRIIDRQSGCPGFQQKIKWIAAKRGDFSGGLDGERRDRRFGKPDLQEVIAVEVKRFAQARRLRIDRERKRSHLLRYITAWSQL